MLSLALARTLALVILTAGPASAEVIAITQSKALAGSVTPGDKSGFPVKLTLPGSYRLGSDLNVRDAKLERLLSGSQPR